MQEAQALQPKKFPCPVEFWGEFRADQIVAETARISVMEARQLPSLDWSEFLFIGSAIEEAKPIAEAHAEAKAKMKERTKESARQSLSLGSTEL